MNEEAIKDAYQLFVNNGYSKSIEDFKTLMSENDNARKDMFDIFVAQGYKKNPEDFSVLMGVGQVKKKENSKVTSPVADTVSPTEQVVEEPTSVESSAQENNVLSEAESSEVLDFIKNMKRAEAPVSDAPTKRQSSDSSPKRIQLTPSTQDSSLESKEGSPKFFNKEEDPILQKKIEEKQVSEDEEDAAFQTLFTKVEEQGDLNLNPITNDEIQSEQERIDSISIKNKFPESANDPVVLRNSDDPFDRGMGRINDLFSQTEAKAAADLRKAFDQYGFKFEEAVGGIDAIKVTSANGEEITVRRKVGNRDAKVTQLKDFLNKNRVESTIIKNRRSELLGVDTKKEKRALTEEDLEEENNIYTNQFDSYQENVSDYNKRKKALSNSTPTNEQELEVYNKEVGNLNALSVSLNKEQENLISSQGELEKLAGDYTYYESQKWDVPSLIIQSIATGALSASVGVGIFLADAVDVADLSWITGDDDKENDAIYKAFKDRIRGGRDMILEDLEILGTTQEAIGKIKKDSFVSGALIGTLESVPAMVSGVAGLFSHSYAGADDALRQYEGYEDLGDLEAFTMKVGLSAAAAYLEKAGLDNAMGKTGLLNRFLLQTLKELPKDASEIVVQRTIQRKAIDFVKGLGSAAAGEGLTGGAQEAVDIGIKAVYNEMKGIDVFKTPENIGQFFEQVVEASAAEAIGGFALGGAGAISQAVSNEKVMDLPDGVIEMFEMMSSSNKFDPLFSKSLKVQLAKGEITKEETQEQLDNYHEAKSSMKQIPNDYTTPQKKMALSLLGIKKRLEKEIEGKDPDLVKDLKEKLDYVKERLSTVKQDVTNIKEGVEITDPNETYFFDFKSKKEIPDALKGLKPVAETISKRSKLGKTQNIRLGFKGTQLVESGFAVIDNEIKLLEENRSKELKEIDDKKFDDTLDLVTDENGKTYRNTKARQKKAEQDRINKVYDDKIAKFNIEKEKTTEVDVKEDVGEINEDKFEAEVDATTEVQEEVVVESEPTPAVEVEETKAVEQMSVDEQVDLLTNILEGKTPVEETKALPRKQIDNQVDNAKKALSKVAPEVEIIVSESEAEYKKVTKEGRNQNTGGKFIDGKIYINPNRANKRTVAHEVFHALLLSKGRTDAQAQAITERMMEAVKKNADQELIDRLEAFSSKYKKALQSEESIAELIGILADGYPQLNPEAKSLIKRWLDRLAKLFGIKPLTSDADIINFLNTVSNKIASGKKIKSRDVKAIGDIDTEVNNLKGKSAQFRSQKTGKPSIAEVRRIAKENGLSAEAVDKVLKNLGYTNAEINESIGTKPSKERVDSIVEEIIEKTKKRKTGESTNPKEILDSVLGYLQGSKLYEKANDTERENAVREINKKLGIKIKKAPSAKKILGIKPAEKKGITTTQLIRLEENISKLVERVTKKNINEKRKEIAQIIKDFEKGNNISTAKTQAIINKISKVKLDNEAAVEKMLDYIAEQYDVARVKEEVSLSNKKRNKAKKNIKSKIGTAKNTFSVFQKLFSYDAKLITDKDLKAKYEAIVGRFGASQATLKVSELESEAKIAQEIIDGIEEEHSIFEDLADTFYENQVLDEDGKIDYKATMEVLSKGDNPILVNDQLDILKKYKSKLELKEPKQSLTEAEQKKRTEALIDAVTKVKVKNNVNDNATSRKSAGKLLKLLENKRNLEGLTDNQLKSLPQILDNIQNGIFTFRANNIMNALDAKENSDVVTKQLNKAQAMAIESIIRGLQSQLTNKTSAYSQIVSNALKDIDTILGLDGTKVYDRTFKRMGSAFASFQEATRMINEELTKVNTKIIEEFKNENKIVEAKFRIQAYMLQLEYESNPDLQDNTVFQAEEWIDATINELKGRKKQATIDILERVKKQVKGKSAETILGKMSRVEKEAMNVIKKINEDTADKALYVSAVVRGSRPEMINEYVHHDVMRSNKLSKKEAEDYYNKTSNIKTKAGTTEGRRKGVKPINMDALNSTMRGTKQTLLDFHVTNENRVIKKTLSAVKENVSVTSERTRKNTVLKLGEINPQEFAVAMDEAYDEAMKIAFGNSYNSSTVIDKMISLGYQAQLASVPRAMAEFSSNLGYAMIANPKVFTQGTKALFEIGVPNAIEYMRLSGSSEMTKFTGAKNTGKSIDMLAKNADLSKAEGRNAVSNAMKTVRNNKTVRVMEQTAESVADALISTPDKAISLPIWVGTFTNAMKESGVDLARFKSDSEYRSEKSAEIEAARNKADANLNKAAGSQNAFAGVLKNKVNKQDDSGLKQAWKYTNGYLTNFLIFEYSTAREGVIALTRGGEVTRAEGLALLAATTTRMASYSLLYKVFASLFFGAFGYEDEQEDELDGNDLTRALVGSVASLFLGRNFGTFTRKGLNMGVEFLNKEYGQVLRGDEEYDSFEHGLGLAYFNPTAEDVKRGKLPEKIIKEISGPLSNHTGLIFNMIKEGVNYFDATNDKEKKEALDYLLGQAAFETVGLFAGKIPLFKDLKKGLYQIPTNNEFALKERQIPFKDLKSQDPDKYSEVDSKFKKIPRIKEIDRDLAALKILIETMDISDEKLEKARYKQSTREKEKGKLKRDFFDKNFGLMDKDKLGKVSKSKPDNGKTLEQELAEIEIIDEKTYKEYKSLSPRKYKRAESSLKRDLTYSTNARETKKLNKEFKRARGVEEREKVQIKINKIKKENSKIKRDIFNEEFKN